MKRRTVIILLVAVVAVAVATELLIYFVKPSPPVKLATDGVLRLILAALFSAVAYFSGFKRYLKPKAEGGVKSVLLVLPYALVVLANFPFTALISGEAKLLRPEYIPLLLIYCLGVGAVEEVVFRAMLLPFFEDLLKHRKQSKLFAILVSSAIFGLWHLFNLVGGAGAGETAVQVIYTFWLGAMFAVITVQTKTVLPAIIFHALFDFGGLLIPKLGAGEFQDLYFWIFTVVAAVICAVYAVVAFIKLQKSDS